MPLLYFIPLKVHPETQWMSECEALSDWSVLSSLLCCQSKSHGQASINSWAKRTTLQSSVAEQSRATHSGPVLDTFGKVRCFSLDQSFISLNFWLTTGYCIWWDSLNFSVLFRVRGTTSQSFECITWWKPRLKAPFRSPTRARRRAEKTTAPATRTGWSGLWMLSWCGPAASGGRWHKRIPKCTTLRSASASVLTGNFWLTPRRDPSLTRPSAYGPCTWRSTRITNTVPVGRPRPFWRKTSIPCPEDSWHTVPTLSTTPCQWASGWTTRTWTAGRTARTPSCRTSWPTLSIPAWTAPRSSRCTGTTWLGFSTPWCPRLRPTWTPRPRTACHQHTRSKLPVQWVWAPWLQCARRNPALLPRP